MVSKSHTTTFLFFTTFLFICPSVSAVRYTPRPNTTTNDLDFIRTRCNVTDYPDVCFTSLAGASSVQDSSGKLAKVAIGVSISQAKSTAAYLSKLLPSANYTNGMQTTIRDCVSFVEDAKDDMRGSLRQLRHMIVEDAAGRRSGEKFRCQMDDVKTWMSGALVSEETCTDELEETEEGGVIKTIVSDRIEELKRFTSNALTIFTHYANNGALP